MSMKKKKYGVGRKHDRKIYEVYHDFMHHISTAYEAVEKGSQEHAKRALWKMCTVCQRGLLEEIKSERKTDDK